ncbi:MAG TPA: hypothetical protein P5121_14005 [Caldilineaceae bacterium]|nr:hypothetical protein [Caldilineaceae bacterium]
MHFNRYSRAYQARIAHRMVAVRQAVQKGVNLENGPLAAAGLTLGEALAMLGLEET